MESNRLTIIPVDGAVYRDQQVFVNLDFTNCGIPADVHALQWKDGLGWIEYTDTRENLPITEQPTWALACVQLWEDAYQLWLTEQSAPDPLDETVDPSQL